MICMRFSTISYGADFDNLEPGHTFRHDLGRTITEADDTLFSLMSMNQHPVHVDAAFAASTQHAQRLVVGPLVIAIIVGLSQADLGGASLRVLEYEDVKHVAPVFHGDTLYAESTIIARDPAADTVTVESRGLNQRGEIVLTMRRKFVAPRRTA